MADNIGGFKIDCRLATIGFVRRRCPDPVLETFNRDFKPAVAAAGPNNCGVAGAKAITLLSPTYGSAAGLFCNILLCTLRPNVLLLFWRIMSQKPTFFSLWIGNNDVLGLQQLVEMVIQLHLSARWCWF
jgi:hypothetical protein